MSFIQRADLAEASAALPAAVVEAIKNGGGLPWGAVFGAITAAAGLAEINAIRSAQFGGGGGGSSFSGGGSVPNAPAVSTPNVDRLLNGGVQSDKEPQSRTTYQFIFPDNVSLGNDVKKWVEDVRAYLEESDASLVSESSRNGLDLIAAAGGGG